MKDYIIQEDRALEAAGLQKKIVCGSPTPQNIARYFTWQMALWLPVLSSQNIVQVGL
jgi:hypothetical protein